MSARGGPGGLVLLVSRSLRQHALSTVVTVLSVALASGLVMAVFGVKTQTHDAFTGGAVGFDAILGARGSQLQLVLNTVFHLEASAGNIPWAYYKAIEKDRRVELAIPYAVGDNYFGFRIVGTTDEIFTKFEYQEGRKFRIESGGRIFNPELREAVLGSIAAQRTGLHLGDTFKPYHGLNFDPNNQHDEVYLVVGVLEPTNSPSDRVIWIPIEGIFRMKGHVAVNSSGKEFDTKAGVDIPDEFKQVSAVMLKLKSADVSGMGLSQEVNRQGKELTLAWPIARVMADLFDKIGWVDKILEMVAYLVVVVASGSILASIYNTMNERRREFAILRALGARRTTVFSTIVAEAGTIAALGSLLGFVVYAVIMGAAAVIIRTQTGVVLDVMQFHPVLVCTPIGMVVIGSAAGVIPAMKAYGTDVATNLAPIS